MNSRVLKGWMLCILTGWPMTASFAASYAGEATASPPDCTRQVHYDREARLPGYSIATATGLQCIPFTTPASHPPAGYRGDYYVEAFSDAVLRSAYADCLRGHECRDRMNAEVLARHPPNREYDDRDPHDRYLLGKIAEGPSVDLRTIRRPAFFAAEPYKEPIAAADGETFIVEFSAPPEPYELARGIDTPVKLRGWYLRGKGVEDGRGHRRRLLVIMSGGGGCRVVAIEDPGDHLYRIDAETGETKLNAFPNRISGTSGQRLWRMTAYRLFAAGYDVLTFDRRGVGISSGFSDTNTLQQGRDLLAIIASLRSGAGLRAVSPGGSALAGKAAAVALRGDGPVGGLPVVLLGSSRGTMASGWAMTLNFDRDCSYDMPRIRCGPARHDRTIKGVIQFSDFSPGVGYAPAETTPDDDKRGVGKDRALFIGGTELEEQIVFFPSSAILAGMRKWPSAFFARGLWDYASALEGSVEAYRRVGSPKELVVVRAPHPFESWPAAERDRVIDRMLAYLQAVSLGRAEVADGRRWATLRELVATASDSWEASSAPPAM